MMNWDATDDAPLFAGDERRGAETTTSQAHRWGLAPILMPPHRGMGMVVKAMREFAAMMRDFDSQMEGK